LQLSFTPDDVLTENCSIACKYSITVDGKISIRLKELVLHWDEVAAF